MRSVPDYELTDADLRITKHLEMTEEEAKLKYPYEKVTEIMRAKLDYMSIVKPNQVAIFNIPQQIKE